MRRLVSSQFLPWIFALLVISITPPTTANAQAEAEAEADTTAVDEEAKDKPSGTVKISIDESGISVEGSANITTDKEDDPDDWVEVYDWRGEYKEKGLDIVKFGESVFVAKDELVRGDLVLFGGSAIIEGKVIGNVIVIGGGIRARSGAEIKGDAVVIGGDLEEDDDVLIHGERVIAHDVFPTGGLVNIFRPWGPEGRLLKFLILPVGLFIQLILAFLVLLFLRDRISRGHDHLSDNFLKSFGIGLLAAFIGVFALLVVMIPLFITIIGIPLALLMIVSCVGVFIIAWTIFAFALGRLVAQKLNIQSDSAFLFVFIGAVIINLPSIISLGISLLHLTILAPIAWMFSGLGWLVKGFAYLSGFGSLIQSRFGSKPLTGIQTPVPTGPPAPDAGSAT
jgi:hypothetical protein